MSEPEVETWLTWLANQPASYRPWQERLAAAAAARELELLRGLALGLAARDRYLSEQALEALARAPRSAEVMVDTLVAANALAPAVHVHGQLRRHRDAGARIHGAQLAEHQPPDALYDAIARLGITTALIDLFACWAQELVVRNVALAGPQLDALGEALVARKHVFGPLPMHLLPLELEAHGLAWEELHAGPPVTAVARPSAVDVTVAQDARIASAFDSHRAVSNGEAEARVFALDPPLPHPATSELLLALGLACLEGASEVVVHQVTAAQAYRLIFRAAHHGGDYNLARSRAHARRDAWRSLGGLVDAPLDAPLHEIAARAPATSFVYFESPDSAWFYRLASDLGIAAVREGGHSLAVLAGTDTD